MPRFFIDTNDGDMAVEDDAGHELANAGAARDLALAALPDMTADRMPNGDHRLFTVRVRDDRGHTLYSASLTLEGSWAVCR